MLVIAIVALIVGVILLNKNGAYTEQKRERFLSLICNIISVVLFANIYGTARGIFIYLAVIGLAGITVVVFKAVKTQSN